MSYEFLAKNGLISQGNVTVTGSLITSQNVTASNISASGTSSFGYVGIGTSSPSNKLDVIGGNINTDSEIYSLGGRLSLYRSAGTSYIDWSNGQSLAFRTETSVGGGGASEKVRIDNTGNVGIGTSTVNFKLDMWGATGTTLNMANVDDSGRGGKLTFISSSAAGRQFFVGTNSSIYNLVFGIDSIEKMRIDTSGNVGINITNPTTKLHVSGSITALDGAFVSNVTSGTDKYFLNFYGTATNQIFTLYENSSTAYLNSYNSMAFRANQLGGSGGYFVFSGANVGIGTSIPVAPLDVVGSTLTAILRNSTAASYGGLRIYNDQNSSVRSLEIDYAGSTYAGSLVTNGPTGESAAITTTGAYPLVFGTSNTARITILSGGNVGIGTTVPSASLDVVGPSLSLGSQPGIIGRFTQNVDGRALIRVVNSNPSSTAAATHAGISFVAYSNSSIQPATSSHEAQIMLAGTGTGTNDLKFIAPQGMTFWVSASNVIMTGSAYTNYGSQAIAITPGGNVGIGTASPLTKLHISGSSSTTITITDDALYTNSISNDNSVMTYTVDTGNAAAASAAHVFKRFNTELVRIDPSGDVGIGTSVPGALLDVSYGDYQNAGTIRMGADIGTNTSRTNNSRKYGTITGYPYNNASSSIQVIGVDATNSTTTGLTIGGGSVNLASPTQIQFYTTSSTTVPGAERVRIDSSGLVGIGTTNPSYLIDVYKTSNDAVIRSRTTGAGAYVYLDSTTDGWYGINMLSGSTSRWFVGSYGTSDFTITRGLGSSEYVRVTTTGNVGIGTTNPGALLELSSSTATTLLSIKGDARPNILYVSASGNIAINSSTFDPLAPEALLISGSTYNIISADTNINTYGQVHTQNRSTGTAASSDLVATNNNGTEAGNYVDLGINGSGYTASFIGNANDGYLYNTGSQFFIGNASPGRNLYFFAGSTTNTASMVLSASGNVGIGITSPVATLQVAGNISGSSFTSSVSNAVGFLGTSSWAQNVASSSFATTAITAQTANALNAANSYTVASLTSGYVDVTGTTIPTTGIYRPSTKTLGLSADGTLIFKISNVSAPATSSIETGNFLVQSGNVGIGTTNPTDKLTVYGALASYKNGADTIQTQVYLANGGNTRAFNLQLNSGGTGLDLWSYNSANAWLKHTTFDYDGRVGIGTAAPAAKLEISGSSNSALLHVKSPISGAILYVSGSGAVGIGTSNVGAYTLQVNGSFAATTKSFVIDHPTKAGKRLIYGSLESPYHGIRLTGRDTLVNGKCKVQLPDYIYKLILHDSVNIQLTGIKCNKTLYVDDINVSENYFTIAYDKAIFEIYNDYDFFWDFTAIRADVPELQTEM